MIQHHHHAVTLAHGHGHAALQPRIILGLHHQLVNHHLDVVVAVAVQLHTRQRLAYLAIHTHVEVALLTYLFKQLFIVTLTSLHQGC